MAELKKMCLMYDDQTEKELEEGGAIYFERDHVFLEFIDGMNQLQLLRLGYGIIKVIKQMGLADVMTDMIDAGILCDKDMNIEIK